MTIQFIDFKTEDTIMSIDLNANPFKVGEIVNLKVVNNDPVIWYNENLNEDYVITSIKHTVSKGYNMDFIIGQYVFTSITVKPL